MAVYLPELSNIHVHTHVHCILHVKIRSPVIEVTNSLPSALISAMLRMKDQFPLCTCI